MEPIVAELLAFQKIDLEAEQTERMIKKSPERKNANMAKQTYEIANENRKKLTATLAKYTAQINGILAKCTEMESLLTSITKSLGNETDPDMLDAYTTQLSQAVSQASHLEKELSKISKKTEEAHNKLTEMVELSNKAKDDFNLYKNAYEKKLAEVMPLINAAREKREAAASALPPELLAKYQRLRNNKMTPLAVLEATKCGGCNMELPSALVNRAASGDGFVECENCGRLLYTE